MTPRKSLNPVDAGAKYLEKRRFKDGTLEVVASFTVVDHSRKMYSIAIGLFNCTATSTMRIEEAEKGCLLHSSYAMIPNGLSGRLYLWRNRKTIDRDGIQSRLMDLHDIKLAAETEAYSSGEPICLNCH